MLIRKKLDGGFINPAYEKFNKIMGYIAIVAIVGIFIALLWFMFTAS